MKALISSLVFALGLLVGSLPAEAQDSNGGSSVHVFPQVADGRFPDGTFYRSTLLVANPSAVRATCLFRLYGMRATLTGRVVSGADSDTFRFTLLGEAWDVATSAASTPFASGYATLTCDQPVAAQILYELYADSVKTSEAAVFAAPAGKTVQFIADHRDNARLGIAIANNTDMPVTYAISARDAAGVAGGAEQTTVAARSRIAGFVDQFIAGLPDGFLGTVTITTLESVDVYATGLRVTGAAFSTISPIVKADPAVFVSPVGPPSGPVADMLQRLPGYINSALASNRDLLPRNPHLASQIQTKIGILEDAGLTARISNERFWSEGTATSIDGRSIGIVAFFPTADMRREASEAVHNLALALPVLERFVGIPLPVPVVKLWYGFVMGNSSGGGSLFMEDRTTYEARSGPSALPYESILDHELSHSYIPHESLNQFLELYVYNVVHTNSSNIESWISARGYVPGLPSNEGIAAVLDVYQLVGLQAMARVYMSLYTLRPPYGQPLGAAFKQVFIDAAPESSKLLVADKLAKVIY
jgi:hypothetical protein